MLKVFDNAGKVALVNEADIVFNDLNNAPYYDTLPATAMAVPILMKANDGVTPRIAKLNPAVLANTVKLFKFGSVSLIKTGLTIAAGPATFQQSVPGLLAGDQLIVTPTTLPNGYGVYQCACLANDVLTVPVHCPALISGGFTIVLTVTAIRNTAVLTT